MHHSRASMPALGFFHGTACHALQQGFCTTTTAMPTRQFIAPGTPGKEASYNRHLRLPPSAQQTQALAWVSLLAGLSLRLQHPQEDPSGSAGHSAPARSRNSRACEERLKRSHHNALGCKAPETHALPCCSHHNPCSSRQQPPQRRTQASSTATFTHPAIPAASSAGERTFRSTPSPCCKRAARPPLDADGRAEPRLLSPPAAGGPGEGGRAAALRPPYCGRQGLTCQMSSAYSRMVRSDENLPLPAVYMMDLQGGGRGGGLDG